MFINSFKNKNNKHIAYKHKLHIDRCSWTYAGVTAQ